MFLFNHFGETIDFSYPDDQRKSMMVYSLIRNESQHLVEKIRSIDPFKVCASIIRKELRSFDFELNDRFCDAEDLRSTLENMCIPEKSLKFF